MKRPFALFSACSLTIIVLLSAFKEDDWLTSLLAKLDRLRTDHPQEKVYLQLDKPYYSIGDDIWFKAYVVTSENNELSALSKVLYVDLVDERDSVRKTVVLPIANGLANGDIKLTDSLFITGNYHIKAYTRWMQNFNSDFLFNKDIYIGDARTPTGIITDAKFAFEQLKISAKVTYLNLADKTPVAGKPVVYQLLCSNKIIAGGKSVTDNAGSININEPLKEGHRAAGIYLQTTISTGPDNSVQRNFKVYDPIAKTDVQFFPEGGRLVNGLRSKVAFKAVLPDGRGANVKGYITDQNNRQITEISTVHAGMGVFALQPAAGSKYTAVISDGAGTESRYVLPVADIEGYVLGINHTVNDSITIRVAASQANIQEKEMALVARQNGLVRFATKLKLNQPFVSTRLAEKRFATGLVQFTLLSAEGLPLAERLLFVNHNDQLKMSISSNKPVYSKREKVEMQLTVKDVEGVPVQGNFSVAVTDQSKISIDETKETSILSNLLLTSDLKGQIENPNYYFADNGTDKVKHLDNLLLTQGWRRFNWAEIKDNNSPVISYKAQKSITVNGRITNLFNKPVPYGKVTLFASTPQGPILADTTADANGNFVIDDLDFTGDVKVVVKARNAKDRDNVKIVLNGSQKTLYNHSFTFPTELNTAAILNYLTSTQKRFDVLDDGILNKTIMLKEISVNEKRINKNLVRGSQKLGLGTADIIIRKEGLVRYNNILQAFYGLAGIEVRESKVYRVGRRSSLNGARFPMQIIVNGSGIAPEMLSAIAPSDVEGIEIIKADYNLAVYGDQGSSGVVEITLKNGAPVSGSLQVTNIGKLIVNGYSVQREFYSPAYDKAGDSYKEADLRSTLYWNPNIVTNTGGTAIVTYFTADEPGSYRAVAEGIDIDGRLARQVYTFIVK